MVLIEPQWEKPGSHACQAQAGKMNRKPHVFSVADRLRSAQFGKAPASTTCWPETRDTAPFAQ